MKKITEFNKLIYEICSYPIQSIITKPAFLWAMNYRIFSIFYNNKVLKLFYYILFPFWRIVSLLVWVEIYWNTKIWQWLKITHFGGIFINPNSIIWDNLHIFNNITIWTNTFWKWKCPIIWDNVRVWVWAKILWNIKIWNNVDIWANSVVIKNIPDNCVVGGIPAKILKYK